MGKDTMNEDLNNVLPEVVEPESDTADKGVTQEVPAPSEVAKPKQTAEENAAFAAMRRQLEAERKEKARLENLVNGFKSGLKPQGYDGNDEDIVAKLNAEAQGVSIDEYKAKQAKAQAERDRIAQLEAENEELKTKDAQKEAERLEAIRAADLKAIKDAFPDVKANSVWELGKPFTALMSTGEMDAVTAYRTVRAATAKEAPPSMGSMKSAAVSSTGEYFTSEELDRLTEKQLDDPKIFEKAKKSLSQIKRG